MLSDTVTLSEPQKTPKLYFPGLNGLRFIAAFAVFLSHTEHFVNLLSPSHETYYLFGQLGSSGVGLFFVISGYLITYLLMIEKESYQKINLRNFYVRRILRIWPLYYFIVILTMVVIPLLVTDQLFAVDGVPGPWTFILFIFFLPFASFCAFSTNFMASILWSVGVEEVYYLFWPLLLKLRARLSLLFFVCLLFGFLSIEAVFTYLPYKVHHAQAFFDLMACIFLRLRMDNMIVGGMLAYIVLHVPSIFRLIQNRLVFITSIVLLAYFLCIGFHSLYFGVNPIVQFIMDPVIFSLLCGVIVVNVTHDLALSMPLEGRFLYTMGQISYGFYVYHGIALFVAIKLLLGVAGMDRSGPGFHIALYICAFTLTTAVAYVSYHYFEAKFLLLKKRFTTVISGNEARNTTS